MTDSEGWHPPLMVLAPSVGFGGGIERIANATEAAWRGPLVRIDLFRAGRDQLVKSNVRMKSAFGTRVLVAAMRNRPTIVMALHIGLLPVAIAAARSVRARSVLFAHGTEVWGQMGWIQRATVRRCSAVLSVSGFTAGVVSSRAQIDSNRITVVPAPIADGLAARATKMNPAVGDRPRRLLTIARLASAYRYKGYFEVAAGLPEVLAHCPDAVWTVVGNGPDLAPLRARCEQTGIGRAVEFIDRLSDAELALLYANSCALVMPSVTNIDVRPPTGEGFGLVYAEAAAFGVPSIASTKLGGGAEIVTDGETGLAVAPGDPKALAAAMIRLLTDEPLRQRLGAESRRRVLTNHTGQRFAEALSASLVKTLDRAEGRSSSERAALERPRFGGRGRRRATSR